MSVAPQHVASETRKYLLVSTGQPSGARRALLGAPSPPDLCVRSPSPEARVTADLVFAGNYIRTIVEPLLARRHGGESLGDYARRCADALYALYALDTRMAFVIVDDLPSTRSSALLLDEEMVLHIAENLDNSTVPQE
jgi:hypothetical protein